MENITSMAEKCSSVDCLGTDPNTPVSCYGCKMKIHLSCADIIDPPKKIFITKNIVFVCNTCLSTGQQSPKRKQTTFIQASLGSVGGGIGLQRSNSLTQINTKSTKTNELKELKELKATIKSLESEIKRNTDVLGELKSNVNVMHGSVEKQSSTVVSLESTVKATERDLNSFASIVGCSNQPQKFRKIETTTSVPNKQKTTTTTATAAPSKSTESRPRSLDDKTKAAIKSRKLTSGNNTIASHGLGSAVAPKTAPAKPKPVRIELPNSIYVSRLETSVTSENLIGYIKQQIPSLNIKHVAAHILVPKDKELESLSFVSFRLRCTNDLFDQLSSPDFWPNHVCIGEFVEKPKQRTFGDFVLDKSNEVNNSNSNEPTESVDSESKNDPANSVGTENDFTMDTSLELTEMETQQKQQQQP
ncbi:MAG: hypothetical protein EOP45_06000 [Sphingobacteriaceae bacterium]|nr:MAG: hypothetical protein EOP45_06000 [Sphingobacteriaceae bacterium]